MRKIKSSLLALAFLVGLVAGMVYAPSTEAASNCWQVDCNICCQKPSGAVICTLRACV